MTTTYNWTFSSFDTAPMEDGKANVIKTIHWRLSATDGINTAESYGAAGLGAPGKIFTAFEDVTQTMIVGWLTEALDVPAIKAGLDAQLIAMANPPIVSKSAPWAVAPVNP